MLANCGLQGEVFSDAAHRGAVCQFDGAWSRQLLCLDIVLLFDGLVVSKTHCCAP